jgi:hypothetical protein
MPWPSREGTLVAALLLSLFLHVIVVFVWDRSLVEAPEPEPIAVTLLPPPPPPPPPPEPAATEPLEFRPKLQRPRERLELAKPPDRLRALAPPPPDAVLEAAAAAGGLAVDVTGPSAIGGYTLAGEGGGVAGAGFGRGNGMAPTGGFAEYLGSVREVGLDVVFVVDATGSMGWLIDLVKQRIDGLAAAIRRLVPVTRFGIVAYRDYDDPEFVTRLEPLHLSTRPVRRFLETLEARGGGDLPEAVDAGLQTAIESGGWKAGSKHVIVLLGDAPPHPQRMASTLALAQAFHASGGTVTAVDVSFDANPRIAAARLGKRVEELTTVKPRGVLPEYQEIARAGGGDSATLEGDRQAVRQIGVLIFGERFAEEVRPLLGDL